MAPLKQDNLDVERHVVDLVEADLSDENDLQ